MSTARRKRGRAASRAGGKEEEERLREASLLYRIGDDAIVMGGEAAKAVLRECWGLGGQVINGAAAAILHLTLEPGYNVHRRRRIESVACDDAPKPSGAVVVETATASKQAQQQQQQQRKEEAAVASWFGRVLSTATSLLETATVPQGTKPRHLGTTAMGESRRRYRRGEAQALAARAALITPRRLTPAVATPGTGASDSLAAVGSSIDASASGRASGTAAGTGHGRTATAGGSMQGTTMVAAQRGQQQQQRVAAAAGGRQSGVVTRIGGSLYGLARRLVGVHSLVLPRTPLRLQLPGSYSEALAKQLRALTASFRETSGLPGQQDHARTGLMEDLQMHLLLAIDSATSYSRKLYRVVLTWTPVVGLPRSHMHLLSTPLSAFPLLRRITPARALTRTASHSAGLIQRVCGYPVERIPVTTPDGYLLQMIRIPRPGSTKCTFFQHGFLDSASAWVSNGNVFSLACRAWEAGFDVFLGNFRGTDDSTTPAHKDPRPRHVKLTPHDAEFWEYSVDDHVLDVMAAVHTIRGLKRAEFKRRSASRRRRSSSGGSKAPEEQEDGANKQSSQQAWLPRLRITGIGHSMGGAVLVLYILHCHALRIPHGLDRMMLLSPAGTHVHVPLLPRMIVSAMYQTLKPVTNAPFPMRSSVLQQTGAKLLQDLKRSPATVDFMASVAACFFGGSARRFAFEHVHFTDYPLGGSSVKVLRHGVRVMWAKHFTPYDYGTAENLRRYGTELPPLYRDWYHWMDLPIHFMAGTKDVLIPPDNIHVFHSQINAAAPGTSSVAEFELGHLDFTLALDDGPITHILQHITRPVPPRFAALDRHTPRADWIPAREAAKATPFLFCFSKLDDALAGIDRLAAEARRMASADAAVLD